MTGGRLGSSNDVLASIDPGHDVISLEPVGGSSGLATDPARAFPTEHLPAGSGMCCPAWGQVMFGAVAGAGDRSRSAPRAQVSEGHFEVRPAVTSVGFRDTYWVGQKQGNSPLR